MKTRTKLHSVTKNLVRTALGLEKADLVIKGGNVVNVHTREILEGVDVAVRFGRVALVGDADPCIGADTFVYDASDKYVVPGLLDPHVHIESSMVGVTEFARIVLPHGTTTVFIDPHEIGNVFGLEGVKLLIDESKSLPLKVFITYPSCVPAAPGFETAGAVVGPEEIAEAMRLEEVIALGEMMNFPGVLAADENVHSEIAETLKAGKLVEGHDSGLLGRELTAYAAAGITSTHESVTKRQTLERLRNGMYVYLREGSAWLDIKDTIRAYTETGIDPRHICLCTDDKEPASILRDGHMDHSLRRAIEEGVDPLTAIQMATINPAERYRLSYELGSIAPARIADILVVSDLTKFRIDAVFADGELVAENGRLVKQLPSFSYPEKFMKSVKLPRPLSPEDFVVRNDREGEELRVRVIQALEGSVMTKHQIERLEVSKGGVQPDPDRSILKLAVVERHGKTGGMSVGFTKGFGFTKGAVSSTVAHDSHNLMVLGYDERDMALAANENARINGGIVTVAEGKVLERVELPLAGLMSTESAEKVAEKLSKTYETWRKLGCEWVSPFMTMSLLSLSVIPELRLTDKGLLDTVTFQFVDLVVD
ncbi:MAG: adenine deaminase [Candidatus Caldarchaeum sp.]|nr:adenine deaminase [Candidatus Caldarchaeum sp.]MDW8434939.1 adenine deaminase [Candidatus Caldarchaeum sp.]